MTTFSRRWASHLVILAGVGFAGLAIGADWYSGRTLRFGALQISLTAAGVLLVVSGVLLRSAPGAIARWRRVGAATAPLYRWLALLVFNVLSLLLLLELAVAVYSGDTPLPIPQHEPWREISYYRTQDWAPALFAEDSQLELEYEPYRLWRTKPFSGEQIQVGVAGDRRTVAASGNPAALEVLAIGGSGMWGIGSPDWGTIPSYLQQKVAAQLEAPVRVVNLAERGYVSTQSLLRLTLELRSGRLPDLVIFYDGFNDVAAAASGRAGDHYDRWRVAGRLDQPLRTLLFTSRSVGLVRGLLSSAPSFPRLEDPEELQRSAERTVAVYLSNYDQVDALSRKFGFSYLFFWQPSVITAGKPLTPEERSQQESTSPELAALFDKVDDAIGEAASTRDHLSTLADALDQEEQLLFVDVVHLNPPGNEIIATAMTPAVVEALREQLESRNPAPQ